MLRYKLKFLPGKLVLGQTVLTPKVDHLNRVPDSQASCDYSKRGSRFVVHFSAPFRAFFRYLLNILVERVYYEDQRGFIKNTKI